MQFTALLLTVFTTVVSIRGSFLKIGLDMERQSDKSQNFVVSPASISQALGLLQLGAEGETEKELEVFLGVNKSSNLQGEISKAFKTLESNSTDQPNVISANGLFVQPQKDFTIDPEFEATATDLYSVFIDFVDFRKSPRVAQKTINSWIKTQTQGQINQILSFPPSPTTVAVVLNALYFKGEWMYPFNEANRQPFQVSSSETVNVDMMVQTADVPLYKGSNYTMLGLPYKGADYFAFFLLPEGNLDSFLDNVTSEELEAAIEKTEKQWNERVKCNHVRETRQVKGKNLCREKATTFVVPKMKLSSSLHLKDTLVKLGLRTLFDPELSNLKGISDSSEMIFATDVVHKAYIELTETGTVAAAATATVLQRGGNIDLFRLDRPFVFFIYHAPTSTVLFWSTVRRPLPNYPGDDEGKGWVWN